MEFPRTRKPLRELPLVPLIDVGFILIIFFMLVTSFTKMESLELVLPGAGAPDPDAAAAVSYVFMKEDSKIALGAKPVTRGELRSHLGAIIENAPEQKVVLYVGPNVSLQSMVNVMDTIHASGGRNVFVKHWEGENGI